MIVEAPFLISIAGLSASLAGLAGLVAGLRRGADMPHEDLFRLREIVEFSFANILIAISTIPVAVALGRMEDAVRVVAVVASVYLVVVAAVLGRRQRRFGVSAARAWYTTVILLDGAALVVALVTIAFGSVPSFEALLVFMLARPMVAFVFVLQSFESR